MKIATQVPSAVQGSRRAPADQTAQAAQSAQTAQEEPLFDKAILTGQIVGGLATGLALGYAGMELGVRVGFESGARALGNHPALAVLSILTVGVARAVVGAAVGAGIGTAVGAGLGAWAGGEVADHLAHPKA